MEFTHISVQPYLATNSMQLTLLSSYILGPPMGWFPIQVLRTQNKANKKAAIVPGRERINTNGFKFGSNYRHTQEN